MTGDISEPGFLFCDISPVVAQVERAAVSEADILPNPDAESSPDAQGRETQGDFSRITALRSTPTPVPARLLGTDLTLLAQNNPNSFLSEGQCGARTDYPTADNDHGSSRRNYVITSYGVDWRSIDSQG
jgi:hypothetical protein